MFHGVVVCVSFFFFFLLSIEIRFTKQKLGYIKRWTFIIITYMEGKEGAAARTGPRLDVSLVVRRAIPSVWNQVKYDTFPSTFCLVGHLEGSQRKMVLQADGRGDAVNKLSNLLKQDEVQYAGFRVTMRMQGNDDPVHKHVYFQWIGRQISEEQRGRAEGDDIFMRQFFNETDVEFVIEGAAFESEADIVAVLRKRTMAELVSACGEKQGRDIGFDFSNSDSVENVTHYDYEDEGDEQALNHDALFNAMRKLQEAGEDMEHLDEAARLYNTANPSIPPAPSSGVSSALSPPATDEDERGEAQRMLDALAEQRIQLEERRFELERENVEKALLAQQARQRERIQERLAARRQKSAAVAVAGDLSMSMSPRRKHTARTRERVAERKSRRDFISAGIMDRLASLEGRHLALNKRIGVVFAKSQEFAAAVPRS